MHKYLKDLDQCERSEIKMAALGCNDERLDPSTRILTVLARLQFLNAASKLSHNKDRDGV